MLVHVEKIDNLIVNRVIKTLCEDVNRVARLLALKQLAKINKALKIETVTTGKPSVQLRRVPSDDDVFEVAHLDLEGNNKPDVILLQSVAGNQMRVSGEKVDK
jgi:hypothetical protein